MLGQEGGPGERLVRHLLQYTALLRRVERKLAAGLQLRRSDLRCLEEFARESEIPIKTLAARLGVSGSRVSHLLDRLERARFIKRRIDPRDRRVIVVTRTAKGGALLEEVQQKFLAVHAGGWTRFDPRDLEKTAEVMESLCRHLSRILVDLEDGRRPLISEYQE